MEREFKILTFKNKNMKIILLLLFSGFLSAQSVLTNADTIYPVKIILDDHELICFKKEQAGRVFLDYQRMVDLLERNRNRDSIVISLKIEVDKYGSILDNNRVINNALQDKVMSYEDIIREKDIQLKLSSREGLVKSMSASNKSVALEIFVGLTGVLLGYLIAN